VGTSFDALPHDFDYIYHYAAINGTKNFYERPNDVMWTNMVCDFNMFEFATLCEKTLKKFVYASSSEIVSVDPQTPVKENSDITIKDIHNARWSYRLPKICSENFLTNS
jgi:nucleoside-diphosphate-sugar epimerase